MAHQIGLQSSTQHPVWVLKTTCGLLTIDPRQLFVGYSFVAIFDSTIDVLLQRSFYIHVSNFSRISIRMPKYMAIAETTEPSIEIHDINAGPQRGSPLGTTDKDSKAYVIIEKEAASRISYTEDVSKAHDNHIKIGNSKLTEHHVLIVRDRRAVFANYFVEKFLTETLNQHGRASF